MNVEPVLAIQEIQGNSLGGFNKDHQALIPAQFGPDLTALRVWLSSVPLTNLATVVAFKREMQERVRKGIALNDLQALWINVCFTWQGIKKLVDSAEQFTDPVFRSGLDGDASRSIGDNPAEGAAGERSTWVIGGPATVPDMLVILGADRCCDLDQAVSSVSAILESAACRLLKIDVGHDLSHFSTEDITYPSGHEHFGFKDGISQPGVRGRLSDSPSDWLTLRPASKPGASTDLEYAQPGQVLVWPGEFVFGYDKQSSGAARLSIKGRKLGPAPPGAADPTAVAPWWATNGSYLVFRRLRQDVAAFRAFVTTAATQASANLGKRESAERMAALLVGRWPSGAPVVLSPLADQQQLGGDDNRNNDFDLSDDGDGTVCPLAAHIRKVNPRNVGTDQGSPSHSLVRRLLRRGIPYGPPLPVSGKADGLDRGLLFLSYQTDIQEQFMFLASNWTNAANAPVAAVAKVEEPGQEVGDGYDLIIGQAGTEGRVRFCVIHEGPRSSRITTTASSPKEWVVATGGGFFFSPSISAVRNILAKS
jgi:Dyp-type peroxidase family